MVDAIFRALASELAMVKLVARDDLIVKALASELAMVNPEVNAEPIPNALATLLANIFSMRERVKETLVTTPIATETNTEDVRALAKVLVAEGVTPMATELVIG